LVSELFGFDALRSCSVRETRNLVFLQANLTSEDGNCLVVSNSAASAMEFCIDAVYANGQRIVIDLLRTKQLSDIREKPERILRNSLFDLSHDATGFVGQFADLADRIQRRQPPNPFVSFAAGLRVNSLLDLLEGEAERF
jgi:hypothetical protein